MRHLLLRVVATACYVASVTVGEIPFKAPTDATPTISELSTAMLAFREVVSPSSGGFIMFTDVAVNPYISYRVLDGVGWARR